MKNFLVPLLTICGLFFLSACGGSSGSSDGANGITVALNPSSPQTIDMNQSDPISATVNGDSRSEGVNWTVSCPMGVNSCGAMAQATTASGAQNMYNAPPNITSPETVRLTATSASDPSKSAAVTVTVSPTLTLVNPAPAQPQPGIVGQPFSFNLAAFVQGGSSPFTWTVKSGTLPAGLTLVASTGVISGTPTAASAAQKRTTSTAQGSSTVNTSMIFTCTDSGNPKLSVDVAISLSINLQSGPLAISSGAPPNGTVNQSYGGSQIVSGQQVAGFPLTATGGTGSYSWTWAPAPGSSLPPGLTISTFTFGGSTRCCTIITVINGTPTTTGTFHVIVTVADSASPPAQVSSNYTITIAGSSTLAITSGPPPSGTAGKRYDTHCNQIPPCNMIIIGFPLTASGGVPPYSWSWAGQGSSPPPGLQINSSLLCINLSGPGICGTPTVAGSFQVVVTVSDSASPPNQAHANYTIVINNPPAPIVNTSPSPSAGALNLPYDFIFTAAGGLSPLTWSQTGPLPPGLTFSTDGKLTGTPTALGSFPITVVVQDSLNRTAPQQDFSIQIFSHGFKATGSMGTARTSHTATVLKNNKVLVAGGFNSDAGDLATAELFDPVNQTFSATGGMSTARPQHTATLLKNGRVLVAGGMNLATAELYDPTGGTFTLTGSMSANRRAHAATLLNDGRVLLTGGIDDATGNALTTAELYDPNSGTFTLTGSMATARAAHTATLLSDGRVLVTGGSDSNLSPLATAEIFDPVKGTFTSVSSMNASRELHAAVLLKSRKVLVAGGFDAQNHEIATAEVFDPVPGTFTAAGNMETGRAAHTATLLNDGTVLVAGGIFENMSLASAELFNPTSGSFSPTGSMTTARSSHTASLLSDGTVLVAGGDDINFAALASAELYK
jgi:Putative Ig domain/Kelch motif/Galactose oxidase, central domain